MRYKSILLILLCVILALGVTGLAGCGEDSGTADPYGSGDSPGDGSEENTKQDYRIALYFVNEEYIVTGNESVDKFRIFEYDLDSEPANVYMDALELLKTPPEDGFSSVIDDEIRFNGAYLEGNTVYVDLSGDGLNGGSMDEGFLISQIVNTLINSFEEAEQVQFLVDGKIVESLMGHVGTEEPFTKDVFTE